MHKTVLAIIAISMISWGGSAPAQDDVPANMLGSKIADACGTEIKQYCAEVRPGGGRILRCLRDNKAKLSDACKAALSDAFSQRERKN